LIAEQLWSAAGVEVERPEAKPRTTDLDTGEHRSTIPAGGPAVRHVAWRSPPTASGGPQDLQNVSDRLPFVEHELKLVTERGEDGAGVGGVAITSVQTSGLAARSRTMRLPSAGSIRQCNATRVRTEPAGTFGSGGGAPLTPTIDP
jgi:hypothetical protein